MSLTAHHANLSSNAKASGRKLVLEVIKNLDVDRSAWLSDVVLKSSLLGTHDTVRTQWNPKNHDHDVKYLGSTVGLTIKSKKSADDIKVTAASEKQTDASQTVEPVKAEKHPLATPAKSSPAQQASHESCDKEKEQQQELKRLREYVACLETEKSLRLKQELAVKVAATSAESTVSLTYKDEVSCLVTTPRASSVSLLRSRTQPYTELKSNAGMTGDKRYEKACREASERAESYATCNSVFVQRAQTLSNLTPTLKKKDEANALDTDPKSQGKSKGRGKGKDKGRGREGKGARDSPSGYGNT
jgi:hypothetical protein